MALTLNQTRSLSIPTPRTPGGSVPRLKGSRISPVKLPSFKSGATASQAAPGIAKGAVEHRFRNPVIGGRRRGGAKKGGARRGLV